MKKVKFYHSVICPRCQASKLLLARVLRQRPGVEITRIELFTNRAHARKDGVTSIPALVAENGRVLSGVILTPGRIRQFLDALDA
ncbi:MAG TPA: thioredoxin family protein [Vicinamibacterales bacterium]|nr:thioredoxin family protein [Vicinamibacterales bacterium]